MTRPTWSTAPKSLIPPILFRLLVCAARDSRDWESREGFAAVKVGRRPTEWELRSQFACQSGATHGASPQRADCFARRARRVWAPDSQGLGSQPEAATKLAGKKLA